MPTARSVCLAGGRRQPGQRIYARLGVLHGVLEPLHASSGVAELRDRLATATAA